MTTTNTNLKQHLRVLKQEHARLKAKQLNGAIITPEENRNYKQHYKYVKTLLQTEHLRRELMNNGF